MTYFGNIEPFVPGDSFIEYKERVDQFFLLNDVTAEKKVPLLITIIGPETYKKLKSLFVPECPTKKSYDEIMDALVKHYAPKFNVISERYKFYKTDQTRSQSVSDYVVTLKHLAQTCDFKNFLNDALRDKFVVGIFDAKLRQKLLNESDLTFEKATNIAIVYENSKESNKMMNPHTQFAVRQYDSNTSQSNKFRPNKVSRRHQSQSRQGNANRNKFHYKSCVQCNITHSVNNCPAKNWKCYVCQQTGHTSRFCRNSRSHSQGNPKNKVKSVQDRLTRPSQSSVGNQAAELRSSIDSQQPSTSAAFIKHTEESNLNASLNSLDLMSDEESIKTIKGGDSPIISMMVENEDLDMEVDTGACVSLINSNTYNNKFSHLPLIQNNHKLTSVTGDIIDVLGKFDVSVRKPGDTKIFKLPLIVSNSDISFVPLIGRSWINVLWPNWRTFFGISENKFVNMVSNFDISATFLKKYFPNVLSDSPNSPIKQFTANIVLKSDAKPIFHTAYTVPYRLRESVEKELENMCQEGIIVPVKYSQWASPIVVVPKGTSLRICIDCKKTINKFVEMEHYPLPRIDDIFADLSNCKYFCVIDLSKAYLQLEVSVSSQEYLTINTSKGLFRYTRLPFGVASAPAIFQSVMDQVLINIKGVKCYLDDILVGASSKERCKETLILVMSRLNQYNIKINFKKCKFFVMEVNFLGHVISESGIRPKPDKMEAIFKAPSPKNVQELQAYLGLLNYYGRFIPNLSSEIRLLYDLLRKGTTFEWKSEVQKVFEKSKQLIAQNNILELYDPDKEIVVSADASPYGVGAVLSHIVNGVEKPVLFVSSSLSPAEKNYSQLHREALAIVFAIKKFHKYIYGKQFTIFSDSQALREIFSPSKSTSTVAASRLQRWSVLLSMYNYTIKYKPAKLMTHADALSRLPLSNPTKINDKSINRLLLSDCPIKFDVLKRSQSEDESICKIISYVRNGWPKAVPSHLKYYFKLRNDFSLEDNCLFYFDRIVVPSHWKDAVLEVLHGCHTGIVRMKMIARSYVWWNSMNSDIENKVKSCLNCQQSQNVNKERVLTKWKECSYPFERIHIDFFHLEGKTFLIIVDAYSKFIEIKLMGKTDTQSVISQLNLLYSYFGLPTEIVSDNGPPFNSREFEENCQSVGIKVTKTPPYHPASNGLGERGVQTCKSVLKKMLTQKSNIKELLTTFLFEYRNLPSTVTGKSPADMILSYKANSQFSLLNPRGKMSEVSVNKGKSIPTEKRNNTTQRSDQNKNLEKYVRNKTIFVPGEKVLYRNHFRCDIKWIPATIKEKVSPVLYQILLNNQLRIVHENQIRKSTLSDKYHPLIDNIPNPTKPSIDKYSSRLKIPKYKVRSPPAGRLPKRKRCQSSSPTLLRRSKRLKKKVVRYGSTSGQ